jgi:UDPglucose 6-dehydrogenase
LAVITEWDAFVSENFKSIYQSMEKPAHVFDGRKILDHSALTEIGFSAYEIGKSKEE